MLTTDSTGAARDAAGDTHVGLVRKENQDRHDRFPTPFGDVHIVADGMGGHRGGATAAEMVIEGYRRALNSLPASLDYREALEQATALTNESIVDLGSSGKQEYSGMGSTVVIALLRDKELVVAHAGDSRAYLWREAGIQRLTKDHTAVQPLVDCGVISEAVARRHPHASLLLRALGQGAKLELDISEPIPLREGDVVLLCSDGLSGRVEDREIEETVREARNDCGSAVKSLIELALGAGGCDNVTVRCVRLGVPAKPRRSWLKRLLLAE